MEKATSLDRIKVSKRGILEGAWHEWSYTVTNIKQSLINNDDTKVLSYLIQNTND